MADLSYYRALGVADEEAAFGAFLASLQTYYDASYYVDWGKVWANVRRFNAEFHLLSSLCSASDIEAEARRLLQKYPNVVSALPALLACRGAMSFVRDIETLDVEIFDFAVPQCADEIERYVRFIGESGLLELLSNIKSVPDYAMGVEVGIDTNGRKNRSGNLAVRALMPHIASALQAQSDVEFWPERNYKWLQAHKCALPPGMNKLKWDGAFFNHKTGKWVLMELNHYGTKGSKPEAIAASYIARERELLAIGVGFLWITDGRGWLEMSPSLRYAWSELRWMTTIQLARDGLLEHALIAMLGAK